MSPKAKAKVKEIELTAVGLDYRITSHQLDKLIDNVPLSAELVREPDNQYDENAIAVYLRETPFKDVHIGYIGRSVAADLAPRMDAGTFAPFEAWATGVEETHSVERIGHICKLLVKS